MQVFAQLLYKGLKIIQRVEVDYCFFATWILLNFMWNLLQFVSQWVFEIMNEPLVCIFEDVSYCNIVIELLRCVLPFWNALLEWRFTILFNEAIRLWRENFYRGFLFAVFLERFSVFGWNIFSRKLWELIRFGLKLFRGNFWSLLGRQFFFLQLFFVFFRLF